MVDRYSFVGDGLFLNENIVQAPDSTNMYKIVWRDVSRDSQVRRIKATLLPPGYICGNSLGVIYGKEDALPYMKMLLAIMNSLIYEFQARSLLVALGFIWAGWKPIIGNDIDKYAIETHRRNIGGEAICGDINDEDIHNTIVSMAVEAKKNNPDLPLFVLGGPPCQGFSTANTRRGTEDLRNWLFKSYAKVVKEIQPDGFVFENVKGILNLDKGKFFEMIQAELKECVEDIKVNKIGTADFGVPQRRDRVIIVGGSYDLTRDFHMEAISTVQKDGQRSLLPTVIGTEDAIGDLPELTPGEDGSSYPYKFPASNAYQKFMRGEIDAEEYLKTYKE